MAGTIGTSRVTQIGFVVKDIQKTKAAWAKFLGVAEPPVFDGGDYEVTQTRYLGAAAPRANCLMAFFDVGEGLQLELIEPNGEPSAWQDYLDEHGEGFHHIAFGVRGMDQQIANLEQGGMRLLQRGKYGNASGEYAYVDALGELKTLIELLESF
ncbi:MAG: VOC family protein [Bacillota bacterium]|nr:VOC family protein [Bacillota bacterium]